MSTPVKLLAAAAFVVVCALGAAQWVHRARQRPRAEPRTPATRTATEPSGEAPSTRPTRDYAAIAQRDLFRPLVAAPKTTESGGGETAPPPAGGPTTQPKPGPAGPPRPASPPTPADPLADLVLTGVVQVGDRLQVLIEKVSAKTGRYVALNEEYEGFRVVLIGENSAVLERSGKQYTLRMGGRQLPEEPRPPSAPTAPKPAAAEAPAMGRAPGGFGGLPGGGMGGFSGDLLSWAESQSLPDLERMYGQYGQYLSPEDRARADAYLEQRRARGR